MYIPWKHVYVPFSIYTYIYIYVRVSTLPILYMSRCTWADLVPAKAFDILTCTNIHVYTCIWHVVRIQFPDDVSLSSPTSMGWGKLPEWWWRDESVLLFHGLVMLGLSECWDDGLVASTLCVLSLKPLSVLKSHFNPASITVLKQLLSKSEKRFVHTHWLQEGLSEVLWGSVCEDVGMCGVLFRRFKKGSRALATRAKFQKHRL